VNTRIRKGRSARPAAKRAVTSHDVANAAGVSQATVSLVLNGARGNIRVSSMTRDRVLAAAAALGYAPNQAARNLRRRSTKVITLILPTLDNPYFAEVVVAAQTAARARGFTIQVSPARDEQAELEALATLRGSGTDGFVASGRSGAVIDEIRELVARGLKAVVLQDHSPDTDIPSVRVDLEAGGYLATMHLISLGHRRIAHIADELPYSNRPREDRFDGYRRALAEAGIPYQPALLATGHNSFAGAAAATESLFRSCGEPPTAIFAYNDQMAIGVVHTLTGRGLRVPDDVALVGFDGIAIGKFVSPELTTIDHPREELGRRAIETLLDLIEGKRPARRELVLPVGLVVRQSCGAASHASATIQRTRDRKADPLRTRK
jgi:DNA-binding LacI/PurR family transcriptional regulator